ncbi:hypothetical protein F3W96_19760 [Salmonella enterica]|nr:hypothetical protein [Salmonella enterica subsp. enterica serovar Sandiego]
MKFLIMAVVLTASFMAHSAEYKRISGSGPEYDTLITRPDTFSNRLRYSFRDNSGFEGVYRIVERKSRNRWLDASSPNQSPALVIKGDTVIFESLYNGKVVNSQIFKEIK